MKGFENLDQLKKEILQKRNELNKLVVKQISSIDKSELLKHSRELDELINGYILWDKSENVI